MATFAARTDKSNAGRPGTSTGVTLLAVFVHFLLEKMFGLEILPVLLVLYMRHNL